MHHTNRRVELTIFPISTLLRFLASLLIGNKDKQLRFSVRSLYGVIYPLQEIYDEFNETDSLCSSELDETVYGVNVAMQYFHVYQWRVRLTQTY